MEFGGGIFEVKSTSGDTQSGGTDMDNILIDYVISHDKAQSGLDISLTRSLSRESGKRLRKQISSFRL